VTITMVTSSYPRFPGDAIATFMAPIAHGVAARGHRVHVVAPWNPSWRRGEADGDVHFHLYRYAPADRLNTFGYAGALRADVQLRASAIVVSPLALAAGWRRTRRVVRDTRTDVVHAHWVVPGGVTAAAARRGRPLIVSLHGSDVFLAERHAAARRAARWAFQRARWVTACSADLRDRAVRLGASPHRISVVPYGVDTDRFRPDVDLRTATRASLGVQPGAGLVFAYGRLVEKKGFSYLVDAVAALQRDFPSTRLVVAGEGDLGEALRARAETAGLGDRARFVGVVPQHEIPAYLAAADVAVVPSVHDDAGNVDGLPNTVMEIMASATPLVTTAAGGIGAVARDGETARIVPERDALAIAAAIGGILRQPVLARDMGARARAHVEHEHSWSRVAGTFDDIYRRAMDPDTRRR